MITGVDETLSQAVFSRTSYRAEDVAWGAKFSDVFIDPGAGRVGIDLRRLHDIEPAGQGWSLLPRRPRDSLAGVRAEVALGAGDPQPAGAAPRLAA